MCPDNRKAPRGLQRFSRRNETVASRKARKQFYGSGRVLAKEPPPPMEGTLTLTIMLEGSGFEQKRFPLKSVPLLAVTVEIASPVAKSVNFLIDVTNMMLLHSGYKSLPSSRTTIVYTPYASEQKPHSIPIGLFESISIEIHRNGNLVRIEITAAGEFQHDTRQI